MTLAASALLTARHLIDVKLIFRSPAAILCTLLLLFSSDRAGAYERQLTTALLHDAYILGQRNDQTTAAFLAPYLKQLTDEHGTSPRIAEIQVLTPFAQVVDLSRRYTSGYSEEQAIHEYEQRGNTVVVRIVLMLPAAFPKPDSEASPTGEIQAPSNANSDIKPENFWQNFRFETKQNGKPIPTHSIRNKPIYSTPTKDTPAALDGATVWLEYDAKDLAPVETIVQVQTPEGKTIGSTFDLSKLR